MTGIEYFKLDKFFDVNAFFFTFEIPIEPVRNYSLK